MVGSAGKGGKAAKRPSRKPPRGSPGRAATRAPRRTAAAARAPRRTAAAARAPRRTAAAARAPRRSAADLAAEERRLRARLEEIERQRWIAGALGEEARALLESPPPECRRTAALLRARPNLLRQLKGLPWSGTPDADEALVAFFLDAIGATVDHTRRPLYQPPAGRALKFSELDAAVIDDLAGALKEYAQHWWAIPKYVAQVLRAVPKR